MFSFKRYPNASFEEHGQTQLSRRALSVTTGGWQAPSEDSGACQESKYAESRNTRSTIRIDSPSYRFYKRSFDLVVCVVLLPIAIIPLSALTLYITASAGTPVFYRQERIGRNGKPFTLYKFRTMRLDGLEHLTEWFVRYPDSLREWQTNHKLKNDPRIIRGGRFLRQTSLDELPQLLNILLGDMTLVGPRPIVEAELAKYGDRVDSYLAAVPGLTGLWQVSGRCNLSYDQRVAMDEKYVREWSFSQDIRILLRTPRSVLRRDGAC